MDSGKRSAGDRRFFEVFETLIGVAAPAHLRTMLMEERIARQTDASVIFAAGNFTFAVILAIAFSPLLHPLFVWPWCLLTVSLSALQLMHWRRKRNSTRRSHSSRTVASIVQKNLVFGLIWGVFGWVAALHGTAVTDILLVILVTVTISGGVLLNALLPLAAVLLYLCAGGMPIIALATKNPEIAPYLISMAPVLLALIVFAARQNFLVGIQFVQREYDLLDTLTKLENATQEKSAFVASTSHELRTPLNAIIGFSDIIRNELFGVISPPRYGGYIKDIHGSAQHLLGVINDLLDLSRIETGNAEVAIEWTDLADLLGSATTMTAPLAEGRKISIQPAETESGLMVLTDRQRLRQVVLNILSNAIKYSASGTSVAVSVDTGRKDDLVIAIKDQGYGMSVAEVRQALTPFGRTESATSTGEQGTGLGLPITRHLMQVLGGDLQIDSVKGQGTTVRILIPAEAWSVEAQALARNGDAPIDRATSATASTR